MLYSGTVILNMSEDQFWSSTPRKLAALFNQHIKYQKAINGVTDGEDSNEEDKDVQNKNALDKLQSLSSSRR